MRRPQIIVAVLMTLTVATHAAAQGRMMGRVEDADHHPIKGATIRATWRQPPALIASRCCRRSHHHAQSANPIHDARYGRGITRGSITSTETSIVARAAGWHDRTRATA